MELWIRSQDKKFLIKIDVVFYRVSFFTKEIYSVFANDITVGNYSSEEKALKVLDMIQDYISEPVYLGYSINESETLVKEVFQMPQDDEVLTWIDKKKNIVEYCKSVSIKDIRNHDYILAPMRYIDFQLSETNHRKYGDIVADLNRIIDEKNTCKLTINETLAKKLGFEIELYKNDHLEDEELNKLMIKLTGSKIKKNDYFRTTKNKNEIKFENNSKEAISSIFMMIFNMWKQHIYYLNQEENRYLEELRDALIPDLMSGIIDIEEGKLKNESRENT